MLIGEEMFLFVGVLSSLSLGLGLGSQLEEVGFSDGADGSAWECSELELGASVLGVGA